MRYHLWLLNATESLLAPRSIQKKIEHLFDVPLLWETRTIEENSVCNLMPDEEYFVPMAIKCLGSLWDHPSEMTTEGKRILSQMKKLYFERWKLPSWESFWDQTSDFHSMKTPIGVGYYDLIRSRHKEGDKHILIGYSQGGVVARFLAFIDEYLFGNHLIDGVITIASPLRGSPLADPFHREEVTNAMIKILLALFSFYKEYDAIPGFVRVISSLEKRIDFEDVYSLLSDWTTESLSLGNVSPYYPAIGKYLATFLKWLSGLRGIKESAFWELAPERVISPFSVLGLVQKPLKAHTAAIVTCNHSVYDIARDYFALTQGNWIRWLWKIGKEWLLSQKVGGQSLKRNLLTIQNLYDREIMGLGEGEAHDFMVPAERQYIEKSPSLGLFFASRASHLSGKDPFSPGGKEILQAIISAMKKYTLCQK
ncbi:hypothetical protein BREVNS_0204 [Brevinematales bacterium NS]|nr:hypothetical protein BREVNS_0204 [Brevinematales bacterium NS]